MNKQLYRVVLNKARGLLMVVGEHVNGGGKGAGGKKAKRHNNNKKEKHVPLLLVFSVLNVAGVSNVYASAIVADTTAASNQQAGMSAAGNGVPVVNIQSASSGGVSHNVFSQFDVDNRGAILNNAQVSTSTKLGGWVQGNAAQGAGALSVRGGGKNGISLKARMYDSRQARFLRQIGQHC